MLTFFFSSFLPSSPPSSPGLALNFILENCFKPESGSRPGVPKIGILITDGKSQDDVIPPAESLRNAGVELFAIGEGERTNTNTHVCVSDVTASKYRVCNGPRPGVKNADENELHSIASEPDEGHVYNVADFSVMSSIVEGLTRTVCEQVEQQDKDIKESKVMTFMLPRNEMQFKTSQLVRLTMITGPLVHWITGLSSDDH